MRYEKKQSGRGVDWEESPSARKIVEAARSLFLEKGYQAVTTREIAKQAGVNLGLIPYYFETKENLAAIICREIKNETYRDILRKIDLRELPAAERMYVYTLLRWRCLREDRKGEFILSLFAEGLGDVSVSDEFSALSWDVIREHKLDISFAKNELYLTALTGAEQMLVSRMRHRELNVTYEEILNIIISNYFFNIGLSDQEIARVIERSLMYVDQGVWE